MSEEINNEAYVGHSSYCVENPQSTTELTYMLKQYGVWNENWTQAKAQDLFREINDREKRLVEYFDPEDKDRINPHLGADMKIVSVGVHTNLDGHERVLKALFQTSIFVYGSLESPLNVAVESRVREKKRAVSGKIAEDEDALEAARREIGEELKVLNPGLEYIETINEVGVSKGYPGIKTFTEVNIFKAKISEDEYKENYVDIETIPSGSADSASRIEVFGWSDAEKGAA